MLTGRPEKARPMPSDSDVTEDEEEVCRENSDELDWAADDELDWL